MDVLAPLGPLTTRPSIASLSDVINIDVVIKQLSGNEGGEGGPRRDIRPARHVSSHACSAHSASMIKLTLFLFGTSESFSLFFPFFF